MIIGLDAGHGGANLGTRHYGIQEELYTLEMAKLVKGMLEQASLNVQLSRDKDETVSFQERASRLRQADFVLVLHVNAALNAPNACDMRTYVLPQCILAHAAAYEIERVAPKNIAPHVPQPMKVAPNDPGSVRVYNTLAYFADKQAVLVEMFFATHRPSAEWAQTPLGKAAIATALCTGCVFAWQFEYGHNTPPPGGPKKPPSVILSSA